MGPQPHTEPVRHRRPPAHLPRQPSPSPTNRGPPWCLPAEAEAVNQAAAAAKKKGYTAHKVDPHVFSKALWVGWQEIDDPPAVDVDAGLLGGILRDKFGTRQASISDAQLNHTTKFTIVGVKPVDYDKGMKLTGHHLAPGRKIS